MSNQKKMNQNEMIRRLLQELLAEGYKVDSTASTNDLGYDIVDHIKGKIQLLMGRGQLSQNHKQKSLGVGFWWSDV